MTATTVEHVEDRILILAPTGRDAFLICDMLKRAELRGSICQSVAHFITRLEEGAGVGLLTEEALDNGAVGNLLSELNQQPAWSDFPLLLLTSAGANLGAASERLMDLVGESANITLLERPIRVSTLLSVVRSSLRARLRQYEVRDYIAEHKRIELEMRQAQKLESIGVLAGGVAHDFNNLLVGILGNASLAVETLPADNPTRPLVEDVVLAAQRAADLTRQLLAYSGKGHFIVKPLNLSDLVREISALIQPSISKMVRVRLDLDRNLPQVEADSSQLNQLVMNLVINGAESIGDGKTGVVTVTTGLREVRAGEERRSIPPTEIPPGRYVFLEVHDDGAGMDQETMSRIFDPFFTTKFTGRGLGLAAALGIVRGHRGGIEVESLPGQGATFRVYLPMMAGSEMQRHSEAARQNLAGAGAILVVDDEEVVRNVVKSCLERYGYQAVLAAGGNAAIETFRRDPSRISVVILDMTMPEMSGEETLAELQRISPDVKVILSSGYNEDDAVRHFTGRSLAGFIQKPYTAQDLAQKVKSVLQGGRLNSPAGSTV